jgi:mycothiol synthase
MSKGNQMKLAIRNYQNDEDYWRLRTFLREVFLLNNRSHHSWDVPTLDYWRWHVLDCTDGNNINEMLYLWETPDGQIVAAAMIESGIDIFFQVHPRFRTPSLEAEMIAVAEQYLARPGENGQNQLCIFALESDGLRQDLLARRGYRKNGQPWHLRFQSLEVSLPEPTPTPGYIIRALGDECEHPPRIIASWFGFHENEPLENRTGGLEWYKNNIQRCPLYRRDLDLVAVCENEAPGSDFSIAAFATAWFDDAARIGVFEPVATVPAHRRRGLSKALLYEAMHRLKYLGATKMFVASYGDQSGGLYAAAGFTQFELNQGWIKEV